MDYVIVVSEDGTPEEQAAIGAPLQEFNLQNAPEPNYLALALLVRTADGKTTGGLWGRSAYDWLFVQYLVVPADLRRKGLGRSLMLQAEEVARQRNCVGVWLDTFSFQAPGFYEKLGYCRFGAIEDYPRGYTRYFMQKRLLQLLPSTSLAQGTFRAPVA